MSKHFSHRGPGQRSNDFVTRNVQPGTHAQIKNTPNVLLVDDDKDFLTELSEGMTQYGLYVTVATEAKQAISIIEKQSIDVVVTDILMGEISGLELLRKLSSLSAVRQIATIVLTGNATVECAIMALRNHAVDFLRKPVLPEEVIEAVLRIDRARIACTTVPAPPQPATVDPVQLLLQARAVRDKLFGDDLFEDPAWYMLLDLFASRSKARETTVSDLCLVSGAPATTALRHLAKLCEAGIIERIRDPRDRRRVLVRLAPKGFDHMSRLVQALSPTSK